MEDASKEFQIYMSPKRDYKKSFQEISTSKQRMVPVISKLSPCNLFQTFTMNQKKTYQAVSGVSFQNSDHDSHNHKKTKSSKTRRQSLAPPSSPKISHQTEVIPGGARRSRSLTSMSSEYSTCVDTNKRETVYPCTPIMLSSGSSNQSQYVNGRRKRRSSSQMRNNKNANANNIGESKRNDNVRKNDEEHPIRPRRTRSASRSRKSNVVLSVVSNENVLTNSKESSEDAVIRRSERKFRKHSKSDRKNATRSKNEKSVRSEDNTLYHNIHKRDIDFNVNDTDWQKYDLLVSKQLNNILKVKDEPEGGYFSLEREEGPEEQEKSSSEGEYFQRENSNESIYVPQSFAEKEPTKSLNSQRSFTSSQNIMTTTSQYAIPPSQNTIANSHSAITIEEIYREVLFDSPSQEFGYVDDEGLYEEICFDRKSPATPVQESPKPKNLIVNPPINILISPENHNLPPLTPHRNRRSSRNSLSTIVHIGDKETGDVVTTSYSPSSREDINGNERSSLDFRMAKENSTTDSTKQNLWCTNNTDLIQDKPICPSRYYKSPFNQNKSTSVDRCQVSTDLVERSVDEELCQFLPDLRLNDHHLSICENSDDEMAIQKNVREKAAFFQQLMANAIAPIDVNSKIKTVKTTCSVDRKVGNKNWNADNIGDQDNDLLNNRRKTKSEPYLLGSSIINNVGLEYRINNTGVDYRSNAINISCPVKTKANPVVSPPSFQGFLQNALFNPDTDSLTDDIEELVIDKGQVVTCITDSSSSESENDESSDSTSPNLWVEAKNEFEFVTFKDKSTKARLPKTFIPKISYTPLSVYSGLLVHSSHNPVAKPSHNESEFKDVPERPSRRRRRSDFSIPIRSNR